MRQLHWTTLASCLVATIVLASYSAQAQQSGGASAGAAGSGATDAPAAGGSATTPGAPSTTSPTVTAAPNNSQSASGSPLSPNASATNSDQTPVRAGDPNRNVAPAVPNTVGPLGETGRLGTLNQLNQQPLQNNSSSGGAGVTAGSTPQQFNGTPGARTNQAGGIGNLGVHFGNQQENPLDVQNVTPNSAAAQIGLRNGDQIVSLAGQNVSGSRQFNTAMQQQLAQFNSNPNFRLPMVVRRNGQLQTLYWTSAALGLAGYGAGGVANFNRGAGANFYQGAPQYQSGYRGVPDQNGSAAFLGVNLDFRYGNEAVVAHIHPGSAAEQAGIRPGDVIWMFNGQEVSSPHQLSALVRQMQPGEQARVTFGRPTEAQVTLGSRNAAQPISQAEGTAPSLAPPAGELPPAAPPAPATTTPSGAPSSDLNAPIPDTTAPESTPRATP